MGPGHGDSKMVPSCRFLLENTSDGRQALQFASFNVGAGNRVFQSATVEEGAHTPSGVRRHVVCMYLSWRGSLSTRQPLLPPTDMIERN